MSIWSLLDECSSSMDERHVSQRRTTVDLDIAIWVNQTVTITFHNWLSCDAFKHRIDSNSLPRNSTAVVDLGYGRRKSSADGHLIVHDILDAKIEYPDNFQCQKKIGQNCWRWYSRMVESNNYHICLLIEYLEMLPTYQPWTCIAIHFQQTG